MRHNIITVAAVAASAILLTLSCTKQEEMQSVNKGKTFIATIEQAQTKTTLENNGDGKYFVNWNSGDLININAQAVYSAEPNSRKAGYAEFTFVKGQEPEPPYRAVYPADLYNSEDKSLYFPMVQQYGAGRCNAPMMAMGDEESLLFHNICRVICFSLTGTDRVRGIELFSGSKPLWGPFKVNPDTWTAWIEEDKIQFSGGMGMPGPNVISLDCGEDGVQLNTEKPTDFYIYLPAGEFGENDLKVNIYNVDGAEYSAAAENAVTVDRNCVYPFEWNVVFENGSSVDPVPVDPAVTVEPALLSGEFTVDANGTKIRFTRGNLYWSGSGWKLENEQYSFPQCDYYQENHVNLLFWTSSAQNSYAEENSETYGENSKLFCDGSDADHMLNIYDQGKLFVLSYEQWNNLLNRDQSFALAQVCGMNGLLLFPDDGGGIQDLPDYITVGGNNGFPEDDINYDTWKSLESSGVVFLPAAGYRGNNFNDQDVMLAYLSASLAEESPICMFAKSGEGPIFDVIPEENAASIRLVQKIDAIPAPPAPEQVIGE